MWHWLMTWYWWQWVIVYFAVGAVVAYVTDVFSLEFRSELPAASFMLMVLWGIVVPGVIVALILIGIYRGYESAVEHGRALVERFRGKSEVNVYSTLATNEISLDETESLQEGVEPDVRTVNRQSS